MALHFVSTSVLSSEDGIEFQKEVQLETEEAKKAKKEAERQANQPLYLQLQAQKDKKQEEFDANTKKLFAPPKAIDEEEAE
jgi:exoribonuclease II